MDDKSKIDVQKIVEHQIKRNTKIENFFLITYLLKIMTCILEKIIKQNF